MGIRYIACQSQIAETGDYSSSLTIMQNKRAIGFCSEETDDFTINEDCRDYIVTKTDKEGVPIDFEHNSINLDVSDLLELSLIVRAWNEGADLPKYLEYKDDK